jgi:hypothetical protein
MRPAPLLVALACTLALGACDSARPDTGTTGPEPAPNPSPQNLAVTSTNAAADGAFDGGTLIVRLNARLDTASLAAAAIRTEYDLPTLPGEPAVTWPLEIWEVVESEAVRVNGEPATFWYDPFRPALLFTAQASETDPALYPPFFEEENRVLLTADLRGTEGERLAAPVTIAAAPSLRDSDPRPVPMPVYGSTVYARTADERPVRFVNLPPGSTITIETPEGETIRIIQPGPAATADWLAPLDATGVFAYTIGGADGASWSGLLPIVAEAVVPSDG